MPVVPPLAAPVTPLLAHALLVLPLEVDAVGRDCACVRAPVAPGDAAGPKLDADDWRLWLADGARDGLVDEEGLPVGCAPAEAAAACCAISRFFRSCFLRSTILRYRYLR